MNVTCWFPQIFDNFDIFWLPHMMVRMQGSAKQCKTYSNINISFPIFLAYSLLGTWGLWLWAVDMFDICGQLSGIFPGVCDSLGRSPELCSGTWVWVQIQALKKKRFWRSWNWTINWTILTGEGFWLGTLLHSLCPSENPEVIASWRISCRPALRIYSGMCEGGPWQHVQLEKMDS